MNGIDVDHSVDIQGANSIHSSFSETNGDIATAEIDNRISSIFNLSIPFHSKNTIDVLHEYDLYSQAPFQELIQEQESKNFPYFLALTRDSGDKIECSDGTAFVRNYFKYNHKISPTTRQRIKEAHIYQIDHLKDKAFNYIGSLSTLRDNKDHLVKFINACDPSLNPFYRGQERYYMGYVFQEGKKTTSGDVLVKPDLKKAFFWYNKSKEDLYFGAPIALAAWYALGNQEAKQSDELYFQNLKLAADWMPKDNPNIHLIYKDICQLYETSEEKLCSESEINNYRNLLEKTKNM